MAGVCGWQVCVDDDRCVDDGRCVDDDRCVDDGRCVDDSQRRVLGDIRQPF